jgi:diguanylate cyclase (GGDEF)-like protein
MSYIGSLDPRTLLVAAATAGAMFCFVFWATLKEEEPLPGPQYWFYTSILTSISLALASMQGVLDEALTRAAANTLLIAATFLLWHGARVFYRRHSAALGWTVVAVLFGAIANIMFVLVLPSAAARIGITSLVLAIGCVLALIEFFPALKSKRMPGVVLVSAALFVFALLMLVRAVLALSGIPTAATLDRSIANVLSHLIIMLVLLATMAGLVMTVTAARSKQVRALAYTDALTGSLSRRGFYRAARKMARYQFTNSFVFVFDVNEFKRINDSKGHETGDNILRVLYSAIRETMPSKSLVARFGGDEFVAFAQKVESPQAIAEKVKTVFTARSGAVLSDRTQFQSGDAEALRATVSVGWAACESLEEIVFANALHDADREMYRVKVRRRHSAVAL